MFSIYIDGKKFSIEYQQNLLEVFLSLGFNIPYFCWHPCLGSIGSCRQCAIKLYRNKEDNIGTVVMSCMISVYPEMKVSILDPEVTKFRKSIIEFMMLNHPHDCLICSEGGKCHLQDMTILNKHYKRRYHFKKRTFSNQFLGFFIKQEMNRCITCYRCVRYYKDYAGGKDFGVYGVSNNIFFGRLEDGCLESEFSGNLIDICPTGVFTEKENKKKYSRKWDIKYTPSICQHCSIGCNISIGIQYKKMCSIENRFNFDINQHFLCDLGRFGYSYLNNQKFSKLPILFSNKEKKRILYEDAIKLILQWKKKNLYNIAGIGSSRASLESNFALYNLVGKKNFSSGMPKKLQNCISLITKILKNSDITIPTISEIETYDVILILGEDLTQTASRAALAVRQAIKNVFLRKKNINNIESWNSEALKTIFQNKKNFLFITNTDITKLDDISQYSYYAPVHEQVKFGCLILECLQELYLKKSLNIKKYPSKVIEISKTLILAKKPLLISGSSNLNISLIKITYNIALFLKKKKFLVGLALFVSSVNSIGVSIFNGIPLESIFKRILKRKINFLIILENDLSRFFTSKKIVKIMQFVKNIIIFDHQKNKITKNSNIFFPCANFSESTGTVINYEARAQRFFKVYNYNIHKKKKILLESWKWIQAIKKEETQIITIKNYKLDQLLSKCINIFPELYFLKKASPSSSYRIFHQKILRSTKRVSGLTSSLNINSSKYLNSQDLDSMFTFSTEGSNQTGEDFSHIPFSWEPRWNSLQSFYKSKAYSLKKKLKNKNGSLLFSHMKKDFNFMLPFFSKISSSSQISKKFIIIPYYKLLGSEEISQNSFEIKCINMKSYIVLNFLDSLLLELKKNDWIEFTILSKKFKFPILLSKKINSGYIGFPIGILNLPISFIGRRISNFKKVIKK
ncbi:NADH-quinone oxidoreductase subunit NuoG [Buchnera aphidicola]|uniref:NADH-quinone oxidoreductase subunit NuoG n=1 Tax=Buchnera aphidicola TaxID=9 RepID=UPI0031B68774